MNEKIDVLAVMDADIALRRSIYDAGRGTKPIARTEQNAHNLACAIDARAAIAELIEVLRMVDGIWSGDQTANIDPDSPLAKVRGALSKVGAR